MKKYILLFSIAAISFAACTTEPAKTNVTVNTTTSTNPANSNAAVANTNSIVVNTANANLDTTANKEAGKTKPDMHNAENSLDWNGVYQGTLPCADCEGIKTTIELKNDKTFTRKDEYLGKNGETFNESGTFTWEKDGTVIVLKSKDETAKFKVTEGSIIMLGADDNETKGELANMYILKKKS